MIAEIKVRALGFAASATAHGAIAAAMLLAFVPSERSQPAASPPPVVFRAYNIPLDAAPQARPASLPRPKATAVARQALPAAFAVAPPDGEPVPVQALAAIDSGRAMSSAHMGERISAADYRQLLHAHIMRYLEYPGSADGAIGLVTVQLRFDRSGSVIEARIVKSSGHDLLDAAALGSLRRAEPLPPIPASLPEMLEVQMPIDFTRTAANASPVTVRVGG